MNMDSYNCCSPNTSDIKKVDQISGLLKLLGDKSRLQILCMLRQNEHCVCELMEHTKLSQSLISHHLKDLKDQKIVTSAKTGLKVYYALTQKGAKYTDSIFSLV